MRDNLKNSNFESCTPAAEGRGLWPWMNAPAFGRDVAPLGRKVGATGFARGAPQQRYLIYSLGTSNRTASGFLDLFAEHGIEVGVDIRSFPTSRYPHFIKQPLQNLLESSGIQYEYLGKELGGFRKGGYLPYMETPSFRRGLERLEEVGRQKKAAFFCSERFPWRCHRRWVAKKLIERGWRVIHIIEKGRVWVPRNGDHKII